MKEIKAVYSFNFHWQGIINDEKVSEKGKDKASIVNTGNMWLLIQEELTKT